MKRFVLFITVLFFSFGIAAAQGYEQGVLGLINFNTQQGFDPSTVSVTALYDIHSRRFDAEAGLNIGTGAFDFTSQTSYRFLRKDKVTLGTGIIYNLNWFYDYSLTHNFLPGFYVTWRPASFQSLSFDLDLVLKVRRVFALHDDLPNLLNTTVAFEFRNDFYIPNGINLFIEVSSIEKFRYMIFCAPSIIVGASFSTKYNFDIIAEGVIHYISLFTLSAYYEDTEFRLGVKYKWQLLFYVLHASYLLPANMV